MASNNRAPKQWKLTSEETLNTFTNWKENLMYTLTLDKSFAPFIKDGVTWKEESDDEWDVGWDGTGKMVASQLLHTSYYH